MNDIVILRKKTGKQKFSEKITLAHLLSLSLLVSLEPGME